MVDDDTNLVNNLFNFLNLGVEGGFIEFDSHDAGFESFAKTNLQGDSRVNFDYLHKTLILIRRI